MEINHFNKPETILMLVSLHYISLSVALKFYVIYGESLSFVNERISFVPSCLHRC